MANILNNTYVTFVKLVVFLFFLFEDMKAWCYNKQAEIKIYHFDLN